MDILLYLFFTKPKPLATITPLLLPVARRFILAAGHSLFGDRFLRDPATGKYAILIAATLELEVTGEVDEDGLRQQILANAEVVRTLLRPEEAAAMARWPGTPPTPREHAGPH